MYCTRCGTENREGSAFCGNCGSAFSSESTAPSKNQGSRAREQKGLVENVFDWMGRHPVWTVLLLLFLIGEVARISLNDVGTGTEKDSTAASQAAPQPPPLSNLTPKQLREAREKYAITFDKKLIDAGIESRTIVWDRDETTLRVTYALTSRVTANEFGKKLDFDTLKALGFKKVILTNDFGGGMGMQFEWPVI